MRIVVLTSNQYHNCLPPFAHFWNKFAGTLRRVTVACYDAPVPELPPNFDALRIGNQADYTWSAGLLKFLDMIEDDVILLMLEDYFIEYAIGWQGIDDLRRLFDYGSIQKIDLSGDRQKVEFIERDIYSNFLLIESVDSSPYQASVQAALWRTSFLKRILAPHETAWQFEKYGTKRIIDQRQRGMPTQILGTLNVHPMYYINAVGGEGNFPGQITEKYMPQWMRDECRAKGWTHG